jgi:hypothetical protein
MTYNGTIDQILTKLKFTQLDKTQQYDMELKEHKDKRSLNANSYSWVLMNKLAKVMNLSVVEIYRRYVKDLAFYKELELNEDAYKMFKEAWESRGIAWICERVDNALVHAYYGSSSYNTLEMSKLIDNIVQDCQAVGIETRTPQEIENLKSLWGSK